MWQIWIDTGGTFTDCIAISPDNTRKQLKVLSNSSLRGRVLSIEKRHVHCTISWPIKRDIFRGYSFKILGTNFSALVDEINIQDQIIRLDQHVPERFQGYEFEITSGEEVPILAARIVTETPLFDALPPIDMRLGSTKGTNALLESKGAEVIFITTAGFEDLLVIRDQQRPHLFCLNIKTPPPIYSKVLGVEERISHTGKVLKPIDVVSVRKELRSFSKKDVSIAIAFLNSYANAVHEQDLKQALLADGFQFISCSTELSTNIKILARAETTVVNAYLQPLISSYIEGILSKLNQGKLWVMASSGSIIKSRSFHPKDSLLSGPAGGIVGAVAAGLQSGQRKIITFDMGGTSTDVAIYNGKYDYQYETKVGTASIQSPSLHIETIAAGGGSICAFENGILTVGPASAGAAPGPACYGAGGPLTITDVNLLAGKLVESDFGIPINRKNSEIALETIIEKIKSETGEQSSSEELIRSFLRIADEKMAEAIRKISLMKGYNPEEYCLVSFGGAGGQHACNIAGILGIKTILIPYEAGILSAYGIGQADIEVFIEELLLTSLEENSKLEDIWLKLQNEGKEKLISDGHAPERIRVKKKLLYLRFTGQETTLEIEYCDDNRRAFQLAYTQLYGHWLDDLTIEIESAKLIVAVTTQKMSEADEQPQHYSPSPVQYQYATSAAGKKETPIHRWEELYAGAHVEGSSIITSSNTTIFLEEGWNLKINNRNAAVLESVATKEHLGGNNEIANLELFKNRFLSVVNDMGAILQRTSFSVNVKERMDFSCALMDEKGYLIVNAPHIPVHLGSMGVCVRKVSEKFHLQPGDVIITNHPAYGGSHLPDVTLISPVFFNQTCLGYVANRAHHAEIGGRTPGSMPTDAISLEEEGVIISPTYLIKEGKEQWLLIEELLQSSPYPSRGIKENLADLRGAAASLQNGILAMQELCSSYGHERVIDYMQKLRYYVADSLSTSLLSKRGKYSASEKLDDGSQLMVQININNQIEFDFNGTSGVHPNNLNATEAIVSSVVLYCLRLLIDEDLPLNEGLLENVKIKLPRCLLNPDFSDKMPAVVGGNTEVSQRLTDTIIKALDMTACSQGTMNNLLFGNEEFGYYETICGGTGAGAGFSGHDAIHQHMTNTKITDPEIVEHRYPVQIDEFRIRKGSGGSGQWNGGNGVTRKFTFKDTLNVTLLTQHRKIAPYGMYGGSSGLTGSQSVIRNEGRIEDLEGICNIIVNDGDQLVIKTPGGGGWGSK